MRYFQDSIPTNLFRVDTLYIDRIDPEIAQTYLNILSDTNSQLNSSYTPLVISITILTGLIAIGAIAAGYFIWRQGKDFKERQDEIIAEFSNSKDEYGRFVESMKSLEKKYTTSLNSMVHKMKNEGTLSQEQEEKLKESIKNTSESIKKNIPGKFSSGMKVIVKCEKCGEKYSQQVWFDKSLTTKELMKKKFDTTCTNCGHTMKHNPD